MRASWSLCNGLFRSCDGGFRCVYTASAFLQVKSPRIMPDRPPSGWKIDLFNNPSRRRTTACTATSHRADSGGASGPGRCPEQASFAVFTLSSSGSQSIFVSLEYYLCRLSATEPASIGDAKSFKNGRQVSAWIGLVPKQNSTG